MKYRFGSITIEAIDTYVRVTVANIGGPDGRTEVRVTKRERPGQVEVAQILADIRGCWPDDALLGACGRACSDAKANGELVAV